MNLENGNFGDGGSGLGYDKDSMSDDKAKKILIGIVSIIVIFCVLAYFCLLYTSPSPRDRTRSRMPSSA